MAGVGVDLDWRAGVGVMGKPFSSYCGFSVAAEPAAVYVVSNPRSSQPVFTSDPPAATEACGDDSCDVEDGRDGDCNNTISF